MTIQILRRKNKELLIVTLLLNLVALGGYGFLLHEIKGKNEHISNLVNDIELQSKKERVINSVKALVVETSPLREKLSRYLVEKEGAVSFIELLEHLGKNRGVSVMISSVEKVPQEGTEQVETLLLGLKASGTWQDVIRFLGLLELLPYEAQVEQLTLSKSEKASPWQITLSLRTLKEK